MGFYLEFYPIYLRVYLIFISIILGLVFGSFGNAWAFRIVRDEKIARGRSHCPKCNHTLGVKDLVPLFSYIFAKGKCRYCGEHISPRYPLSELVTALCFASILIRYGISVNTIILWAFCFFLMVLSFADWESMIIPDRLIILAGLSGLLNNIPWESVDILGSSTLILIGKALLNGLILAGGLLVIVLIADRVLKKETMGGGDIKLVFVIGLTLGLMQGLLAIFISCIIGLIFAYLPGARNREGEDAKAFPFGPGLAIATWIVLLIGDVVITWYTSLLYL